MSRKLTWLGYLLAVVTLLMLVGLAGAQQAETLKIMPFVGDRQACVVCHAGDKDTGRFADLTRSCDANCVHCHKDRDQHHPVGPEKDRVNLPLLGANKVACITCHDLKIARYDVRSWKSQSLFGRLFQRQKTYKTYYLRVNNSAGDMCRTCH